MKKYLYAALIVLLFGIFAFCIRRDTSVVLGIVTPTKLQIDLNNNNIIDDNETICIPDVVVFTADVNNIVQGFSTVDSLSLGYLAEEFAAKTMLAKPVKVHLTGNKNQNCRFANITIEDKDYKSLLRENGFTSDSDKAKLDENLAKAKKLDLKLLNMKSLKYHKLDCEYGVKSSDYTIVPKRQLPKDATKCKFCLVKQPQKPKVVTPKPVKLTETSGSVRLILNDFTKHLKPNYDCNVEACKALVSNINSATKSIDIATYGWDNIPKVKNALTAAKARGVKIRVVYDAVSKPEREYYKNKSSLVELADESNSDFVANQPSFTDKLMHNKFIIFDNKTVYTGSANLSTTGLSGYNADVVFIINSKEIADLYKLEFEQMLSGKFHNKKVKLTDENTFKLGSTTISVYFSPYDHVSDYIIERINSAQKSVYIPVFVITHNAISNSIIAAKSRGVDVRIIVDANSAFTINTKLKFLRQNKIPVKVENYAGKLHSKSIIIDDKYLIAGSMNFSNSGENKNDENVLIIEDEKLAKIYKNYFLYLWNVIPNKWLYSNPRPESLDSIGSCTDGIDNNFDGNIDSADKGCKISN